MSSSVIASLISAYQRVITYSGIPILALGLIGNSLNLIVFLSLRTFRQNSCAFYLTMMSMINIAQLLTGLLSRIMISGFDIDWTEYSLFYCKFRTFIFQVTTSISYACLCLATIDQYLSTCTRPHWQQWCNIRIACRLLLLIIPLIIIEQIPTLIYYVQIQSSGKQICTITDVSFVQVNTYLNYLTLGNVAPLLITVCFGSMAYRNIRQIAYRTVPIVRRELDKQLSVMVLVQGIYFLFTVSPNLVAYIIDSYGNIQDSVVRAQVNLVYAITLSIYYSYYASPFYIYISVSGRFRRQFIYVIFNIPYNQFREQRIHPEQPVFHL